MKKEVTPVVLSQEPGEENIIKIGSQRFQFDGSMQLLKIETLKVGSPLMVSHRSYAGSAWSMDRGVIISMHNFEDNPTIGILTVKLEYNSVQINVLYYSEQTKDNMRLSPAVPEEALVDKETTKQRLHRKVIQCEDALENAQLEEKYVLQHWGALFTN
jgi:hypothetical protein